MVDLHRLLNYLDQVLSPELFSDYCPNGLQVQGCDEIKTLITGVTANQALLDAAVKANADVILVHHGYFWRGEDPRVVGIKRNRLLTLLENKMSLIAYHLPLDAHVKFGNNIQLAERLGIELQGNFSAGENPPLGCLGSLENPISGKEFARKIEKSLARKPLYIPGQSDRLQRIAWCTGAAQDFIFKASHYGVDAFITGEVSERTVNIARETGMHFYAAGHHATERYGVAALGEHLAQQFELAHQFIDIDNPA